MKKIMLLPAAAISLLIVVAFIDHGRSGNRNVSYIKTDKVTDITMTSVRCYFTLAGDNMLKAGVCLNQTGNPTTPSKLDIPLSVPELLLNSVKPKQFNVGVKGLNWNSTYFIRCYVKHRDGTVVYGNELSFKTQGKP